MDQPTSRGDFENHPSRAGSRASAPFQYVEVDFSQHFFLIADLDSIICRFRLL
jgi:hypothetical protein